MGRVTKLTCSFLLGAVLVVSCILPLCFPLWKRVENREESYDCVWENGLRSKESYVSAYAILFGGDGESLILLRESRQGKIAAGKGYQKAYSIFNEGSLAELLNVKLEKLAPLEHAALWKSFGNTVWLSDGESFRYNGQTVERTKLIESEKIVLISGKIPNGYLKDSGASILELRAESEFSAEGLKGSCVREVLAREPYSYQNGGVYLANGKRLVAALPHLQSFTMSDDAEFCDKGALSGCENLQEIVTPFIGNAKFYHSEYDPHFGYSFGLDENDCYAIPKSLKRITVTGGLIKDDAFAGCEQLEEIDVRKISYFNVSPQAFLPCKNLQKLYCSRYQLELEGQFTKIKRGEYYEYSRKQ